MRKQTVKNNDPWKSLEALIARLIVEARGTNSVPKKFRDHFYDGSKEYKRLEDANAARLQAAGASVRA